MTPGQRFVVSVSLVGLAILLHTFYCEWHWYEGPSKYGPVYPLLSLHRERLPFDDPDVQAAYQECEKRSDPFHGPSGRPTLESAREWTLCKGEMAGKGIILSPESFRVIGLYPEAVQRMTKRDTAAVERRHAFWFGVLVPIVLLAAALFVLIGRSRLSRRGPA